MKIRLNIFLLCSLFLVVELHGQKADWTLPTPDTDKLPTALIPYPDEVIRKEGVIQFSAIKADRKSLDKLKESERIGEELNDVCMFWNMPERPTGGICRIYFEQHPAQQDALKREAYKLVVSDDKVVISAGVCRFLQCFTNIAAVGEGNTGCL